MKKLLKLTIIICLTAIVTSAYKNKDVPKGSKANLEIKINATKKLPGKIKVALCKDPETFMEKLYLEGEIVKSQANTISYTFKNVPLGVYAVRIFQDVDGDGELTANLWGIPKEPFGFSLNPTSKFGPPTFKQASFELKSNISLTIDLAKL
jgi:uncharacterized protein (DUF2141 family)